MRILFCAATVVLRCGDMDDVDLSLRKFHIPVVIFPDKPYNMQLIMRDIGEQFKLLCADGMMVTPGELDEMGRVRPGVPFLHRPFLSSIYADSVARQDFAFISGSANATMVCQWCALPGTSLFKTNAQGVQKWSGVYSPQSSIV